MTLPDDKSLENLSQGRGFFAVDRQQWPKVCALGLNAAVAYLVLARGSDRSNRRTTWSANAIADRTSISRRRGHAAIDALCAAGIVRQSKGGARPAYELQSVLETTPRRPDGTPANSDEPTEWIWLPNTLIDGLANGGACPVERIRQAGDVMVLRLFVELYGAHELRDDGGIDRRIVWRTFGREEIGEYAEYRILAFTSTGQPWTAQHPVTAPHRQPHVSKADRKAKRTEWSAFWDRWFTLEHLGLVQWVTVLWESDAPDAEPIHPLGGPEADEQRLGWAARTAATYMLGTIGVHQVPHDAWLVPVLKHFTSATVIGIARLRYRPHTKATAAWFADLKQGAADHEARYQEIARQLDAVGYGQ